MGPFPIASTQRKFLLVATDYFTKWVKAEPLATIIEKKVEGMVWKDIIFHFGFPRILNTGHGTQFDSESFRGFCQRWGIRLRMASVAYPQANGQAEVSNKTILHGLKTRLKKAKGKWADELLSILWAYRTTSQVSMGEIPFNLVHGVDALIPVEVDLVSPRVMTFSKEENSNYLRDNLDLLDELRE